MNSHDTQFHFNVSNVPISFPYSPYRAQFALMYAVVNAIKSKSNILIESPTGTGKTCALLCSAIATQHVLQRNTESGLSEQPNTTFNDPTDGNRIASQILSNEYRLIYSNPLLSDDVDFELRPKFRRTMEEEGFQCNPSSSEHLHDSVNVSNSNQGCNEQFSGNDSVNISPRIFYCSRTHQQLKQVTRELYRTVYRPKISVLGSRKEYCINEYVRRESRRDELCLELKKKDGCTYHKNSHRIYENPNYSKGPYDIEELVEFGKDCNACPYYAIQQLYDNAEVIFCPYNYVLDPIIRKAKHINITDDIIIFDEAHNLESQAREAISFRTDSHLLKRYIDDLYSTATNVIGESLFISSALDSLQHFLYRILDLIDEVVNHTSFRNYGSYDMATFQNQSLLDLLLDVGIARCTLDYWKLGHEMLVHIGDGRDQSRLSKLSTKKPIFTDDEINSSRNSPGGKKPEKNENEDEDKTKSDSNMQCAHKIKKEPSEIFSSYQHQITGCINFIGRALLTFQQFFRNTGDFTFYVKRNYSSYHSSVCLGLICLNSGTACKEVEGLARSVIVTSGTLSPIAVYANELGMWFNNVKALPHVINVSRQVFGAVQATGCDHVSLEATYRNASTFEFQDSLGATLLEYCKVIPHGKIVFFPSYKFMHRVLERWEYTSTKGEILKTTNKLFIESCSYGNEGASVSQVMDEYRQYSNSYRGATLFAVYRGKYSEGIDFSENMSRGVLAIGIPYPNITDYFVSAKRSWNDETFKSLKNIQYSGQKWYEAQAFRAVNQALGRAIRNRTDFSSIILLDPRYLKPNVLCNLSPWIREAIWTGPRTQTEIVKAVSLFFQDRFKCT